MMKHFLPFMFSTLLATAPAALAQNWEVGAGGGGNFYTSQTFTNPAGNAAAKLASGFIVSAWLDNNTSGQFGGELRYDYEHSDLKLSSDGTNVSFGGAQTNAIHYDAVLHFASTRSTRYSLSSRAASASKITREPARSRFSSRSPTSRCSPRPASSNRSSYSEAALSSRSRATLTSGWRFTIS